MTYTCSVCEKTIEGDVLTYIDHTQEHIIEEIRANHPDWQTKDGLCPKCVDYYRKQMEGNSSS